MDTPTWETGPSSNLEPVPRSIRSDTPTVDIQSDLLVRARRARVKIRHRSDERAASIALGDLLRRPRAECTPSTFGLDERELRAEARRLYASGWSLADITAVLAVEPVRAAS